MRPAPASSTTATATSPAISQSRNRPARRPPELPRPASLRFSASPARDACIAGASPAAIPTSVAITAVNASTRPSIPITSHPGNSAPMIASNAFIHKKASAIPSADAANASTTLSVRSCPRMSSRLAPSATRTPISRSLPSARESRRLTTFAHAMSSTNPTAVSRISR